MILKDRFLPQLAPDIHHKLLKQVYGPNQSLDNLCNWLRWFIIVRNVRRIKTKTKKQTEALVMAVRTAFKQPVKNFQRDHGEMLLKTSMDTLPSG